MVEASFSSLLAGVGSQLGLTESNARYVPVQEKQKDINLSVMISKQEKSKQMDGRVGKGSEDCSKGSDVPEQRILTKLGCICS